MVPSFRQFKFTIQCCQQFRNPSKLSTLNSYVYLNKIKRAIPETIFYKGWSIYSTKEKRFQHSQHAHF